MFRLNKREKRQPAPEAKGPAVRRHMVFRGRVQGVGFRYQAVAIGKSLGLTGWVRNCYDGSVEMEAQGDPETIGILLEKLQHLSYVRIDDMEVTGIPVEEEHGFRATY